MPKINVTVKWSGKKFENMELGKEKKNTHVKSLREKSLKRKL